MDKYALIADKIVQNVDNYPLIHNESAQIVDNFAQSCGKLKSFSTQNKKFISDFFLIFLISVKLSEMDFLRLSIDGMLVC